MQVILKPLHPPELEEIVIDDGIFPVGRYQQPFVTYEKTAVAHLSRRHARIFEEKGAIFIADTGSRNGTKVNGEKLQDRPVRLARGDEICFGGALFYRVNIPDQTVQTITYIAPLTNFRLILTPTHDELDTVVVDQFPFLISKSNKPLAQYAEKFPKDISYVSRRHAYFFIKEDDLFIEDLGSSNGTYVNGTRLDENAKLLKDGDSIEIGSDRFTYTVKLECESQPITPDSTIATTHVANLQPQNSPEPDKTTFVSAANSFLDIFCVQEDEVDTPIEDDNSPAVDKPVKIKPAKTSLGRSFQRTRAFLIQLKGALAEDRRKNRNIWLIASVLCITGTVALSVYSLGAIKREIETLMEEEKYQQTLVLANKYLITNPQDDEILQITTEALLKSTVPQWITAIEQNDYALAHELVTQAKLNGLLNKSGSEIAKILEWVVTLEHFIHSRGGIDAPIVIFSQEKEITTLLDWWEQDEKGYRRSLGLVADYTPEFKDIYSRVFSNLRALRSEKSVYLTAINRLRLTIEEKLDSEKIDELGPVFDKFESKYPRIIGMDKVRRDLESYLTLKSEVDNKNLRGVIDLLAKYRFEIPPFKENLETMLVTNLPTNEFIKHYLRASIAWRAGKSEDALTLLSQPVDSAWQELVTAELNSKQRIVREFEALRRSRGTQDYDSRLMAFYDLLDDNEDSYFLKAIAGDFKNYSQKMAVEANQILELARKDWNAYRQSGGIQGLQRLEANISPFFKKQAKRLSDAYIQAKRGIRLYEATKMSYRPEWKTLYDDVKAETELQRLSLEELGMVLKPSLLNDKLELIPEL